jgi:SAM-dependent methyltransferase
VSTLDVLHGRLVFGRRVDRLADALAARLPADASVLDVGCGDGSIARAVLDRRPDLSITGVDVLVRDDTSIPVRGYDGTTLPFGDHAFDAVSLVDVLHHTDDPGRVLQEAARVSGGVVLIKDHLADSVLARPTLRLMDWIGNARHGVRLPYNYLTADEWDRHFDAAGLAVSSWETRLDLYPPPLSFAFGRRLHVLAVVEPTGAAATVTREEAHQRGGRG